MITHKIQLKVKTTFSRYTGLWPFTGAKVKDEKPWYERAQQQKPIHLNRMGKLAYAKYLSELKVKHNDVVISIHRLSGWTPEHPIPDLEIYSFYRVQDIQELHGLVDYSDDGEPKSLYLKPLGPQNFGGFWSCPDWWICVTPDMTPPKLKAFLESERDNPPNKTN